MAIGVVLSLILFLCALSAQQTACNGSMILVISDNGGAEMTTTTLVEYVNGSFRGECLVNDEDLNLNSSQACTIDSPVGFCTSILANFFNRSVTNMSTVETTNSTFADLDELCSKVANVTKYLNYFKTILDRTLVDVYLRTCEDKTDCLNAYMQWLCSTQLPLFELTNVSANDCSNSDTQVLGNNSFCYARSKPCLGVCHGVLQKCPYYLPSKYQSDEELDAEFVFGGYPAFACPTEDQVGNFSSYNVSSTFCPRSGAKATAFTQVWTLFTVLLLGILWCQF